MRRNPRASADARPRGRLVRAKSQAGRAASCQGHRWARKRVNWGDVGGFAPRLAAGLRRLPYQPWIDGFKVGAARVRQFVAVALQAGLTVEYQLTGRDSGAIGIASYAPRADVRVPPAPPRPRRQRELGLGAGGMITQRLYPDPYGLEIWQPSPAAIARVHLLETTDFLRLTGEEAPPSPIDSDTYNSLAGCPGSRSTMPSVAMSLQPRRCRRSRAWTNCRNLAPIHHVGDLARHRCACARFRPVRGAVGERNRRRAHACAGFRVERLSRGAMRQCIRLITSMVTSSKVRSCDAVTHH